MLDNMNLNEILKQSEEYKAIISQVADNEKDKYRYLYQELIEDIDRVTTVVTDYYKNGSTDEGYVYVKDAVWDLWLDIKARTVERFLSEDLANELRAYFWSLIC